MPEKHDDVAGKEYLSPREVGHVLGVSYEKVLELMKSGKLRYGQISPRCRRISRAAIDEFLGGEGNEGFRGANISIHVSERADPDKVAPSVVKALSESFRRRNHG